MLLLPLLLPATTAMTLQSGQQVDLLKLADAYQQDCIPVSVLNDFTPIVRLDGGQGRFFVSNDPGCAYAIPSAAYPSVFAYIYVGECRGGNG
jgi:hypothetical protein